MMLGRLIDRRDERFLASGGDVIPLESHRRSDLNGLKGDDFPSVGRNTCPARTTRRLAPNLRKQAATASRKRIQRPTDERCLRTRVFGKLEEHGFSVPRELLPCHG